MYDLIKYSEIMGGNKLKKMKKIIYSFYFYYLFYRPLFGHRPGLE
jgi:hypothetical protein